MKTYVPLSATTILLLLLHLRPTTGEVVFDTRGRPVEAGFSGTSSGAEYHIVPAKKGQGGGVSMMSIDDKCPFHVALEANDDNPGIFPIKFETQGFDEYLYEGQRTYIKFADNAGGGCEGVPRGWKVVTETFSSTGVESFITIGANYSDSSEDSNLNYFLITQDLSSSDADDNYTYQIHYQDPLSPVVLVTHQGKLTGKRQLLAVGVDEPLLVKFERLNYKEEDAQISTV